MSHVLAAAAPSGTNTDSIAVETIFWILAVISVGAALAMILVRQAVHCAIMLAVVMLSPGHHVRDAGRAVPRLRADHRLHRRGPDAVPVRPHADRHQLGGLDRGDDQGPADGRRARRDRPVPGPGPRHRARGHRPGREDHRGERHGQPDRAGPADLHHLRVPVRSHRRAADHRGGRRDGAGAPRAHRAQAHPARSRRPAAGQRPAGPRPGAGRLRAARRRGPAGPAAGRLDVGALGQPDALAS